MNGNNYLRYTIFNSISEREGYSSGFLQSLNTKITIKAPQQVRYFKFKYLIVDPKKAKKKHTL